MRNFEKSEIIFSLQLGFRAPEKSRIDSRFFGKRSHSGAREASGDEGIGQLFNKIISDFADWHSRRSAGIGD